MDTKQFTEKQQTNISGHVWRKYRFNASMEVAARHYPVNQLSILKALNTYFMTHGAI